MRQGTLTPAHRVTTSLAAISLAVTSLTACGSAADEGEDPSANPAGTSSAAGSAPTPPRRGGGVGGAYCDVFRDQGATLLLLRKVNWEPDPARVKADFDSVVSVYQALADAAPPELRPDAEVLLKTFKDDRAEIARAGWTPRAVTNALAGDLSDDAYVNAAGHHMAYLQSVCHIDPANPAAVPTSSG